VLLYFSVRPGHPFARPRADMPRGPLVRLGSTWLLLWLIASWVAAGIVGHWIRYTSGTLALLCFVGIGPLQEELL